MVEFDPLLNMQVIKFVVFPPPPQKFFLCSKWGSLTLMQKSSIYGQLCQVHTLLATPLFQFT